MDAYKPTMSGIMTFPALLCFFFRECVQAGCACQLHPPTTSPTSYSPRALQGAVSAANDNLSMQLKHKKIGDTGNESKHRLYTNRGRSFLRAHNSLEPGNMHH
jgi:hypothetical protein